MNILFVDTVDKKLHIVSNKVDIHTERNNHFFATSPLFTPPHFPPAGFASPPRPMPESSAAVWCVVLVLIRCPLRGRINKLSPFLRLRKVRQDVPLSGKFPLRGLLLKVDMRLA